MTLQYDQSKRLALAALIVCAVGTVVCRWFEDTSPFLSWGRAFFEAATIGALADWFAVVVLFRHPLGIPIPHTAVLPKNKSRVADSLATFLETSFLTEVQLGPRFRSVDYAGIASRWLEEHAPLLAEKAARFAPDVLGGLRDDEMASLLGERARALVRTTELGPAAAAGLEVLVQNGRDREIFLAALKSARGLIGEHRAAIQEKIRNEIPLSAELLRSFPAGRDLVGPLLDQLREGIASAVAAKTVEKVQSALDEAGRNPNSALWQSFDERLRRLIRDLGSSPEMAAKLRDVQDAVSASDALEDFASKTWSEIKAFILQDCASADSAVRAQIENAIRSAARHLAENSPFAGEVNAFLGDRVLAATLAARPKAREIVVSTIEAWDAQEMADRLEKTVGADLQFIRLNGTLVGGLVGLAIHGAFAIFGK